MNRIVSPIVQLAPHAQAEQWLTRCAAAGSMPTEVPVPAQPMETLAALAAVVLGSGKTLLILVPDDEPLPALSTALDLSLRPLCLVLPSADFAARIALRATLSLLKSRLARDNEEEQKKAWQMQQRHLDASGPLWQKAMQWSAANDRSPWPLDVAKLFPARILPIAAYRELAAQAADFVVFYQCDLGLETATLPGRHLHVGQNQNAPARHALAINDEAMRLRLELSQLTQDVADLELELVTAQAEMADFTRRYYEVVGRRMSALDAIRAQLASHRAAAAPGDSQAQMEAEKLRAEAEQSASESRRFKESEEESGTTTSTPFRPSQDIKRMFRQLAQRIHPDRASTEGDRAWRTQLMSEANRAYRAADVDALREVAALWEEGSVGAAREVATPAPRQDVLAQQVERMRQRFGQIEAELHRLFGSRLYELFVATRQAYRQGRDLLQEMADSLDSQIQAGRIELDASA